MAKTYTNLTAVATGDVLTATGYNNAQTTLNNHTVPPMASVYRNAALSQTATASYQAVSFDTEHFTNTDSMWVIGSPTRITLSTIGIYLVTGVVTFGASATGLRSVRINKNGSSGAYGTLVSGNVVINYLNVSAVIEATAITDYVELAAYQDTGGNLAYNAGADQLRFSAVFMGRKA